MTTGSIIQGATDKAYYYNKSWTGSDGKYAGGKLKENAYSMSCTNHKSRASANGTFITPNMGMYTQQVSWDGNDELKLLGKLSDKARGHSFNLGVALAESSQTLRLVTTTCVRLASAARAIRRGDVSQALRSLGAVPTSRSLEKGRKARRSREFRLTGQLRQHDVSSMWLEIQYGWKPLLRDIHEGMTAYAVHTNPPRQSRYSVSGSKRKEIDIQPLGPNTSGYLVVHSRNTVTKTITVTQTEKLSVARSLGLADPRSIAWEKMPFSFVVDWFIPIGTYLDALATVPFITASYQIVTKDLRVGDGNGGSFGIGYPHYNNYFGASAHGTVMLYNRSYSGSIAVPLPRFKPMGDALSVGHLKNAVALLHQLLVPKGKI